MPFAKLTTTEDLINGLIRHRQSVMLSGPNSCQIGILLKASLDGNNPADV